MVHPVSPKYPKNGISKNKMTINIFNISQFGLDISSKCPSCSYPFLKFHLKSPAIWRSPIPRAPGHLGG
jgi:hypothetical protein